MQQLFRILKGFPGFPELTAECQTQVRSYALYRIEPHAPLVVRLPVNSFEF